MRLHELPEAVIDTFLYYFNQLKEGKTGYISENDIDSVVPSELANYNSLTDNADTIERTLKKTIVIKLNGGLGTTMGLRGAKSLIPVKNGLTFLDITALQTISLNKKYGFNIPLLLMNSFRTEEDSTALIAKYPELKTSIPLSFLQHKYPKILVDNFQPALFPQNPDLEWNPPGHGDLYTALITSGILTRLLESSYEYAFVSNIDNLGANLDPKILDYFASSGFSFLMEVTERTWMDRKGGHLARLKSSSRLTLRESSQCAPGDINHFKDIKKHSFFNTNNLWIHLTSLNKLLCESKGHLHLPLIRNKKRLDPVNTTTPEVFQVETAMGSAISVFENASAIQVPRTRFAPVKNCEELLLLWSDQYILDERYHITPNTQCGRNRPTISLDPQYYSWIDQLNLRFPSGAPSLCGCDSLTIKGDVTFGNNVVVKGTVAITNESGEPRLVPDNAIIDSAITL
ncbi:MAG TPA: UTP--glucose-1-phosphate uridylyltransferase [Chitinispirillaceae bacterium]|nr:UTP--glucose-1-phosphate uridylyltransferase [Chitinispirillaceae bacterium]